MKIKQLLSLALIGLAVGACKRPNGGEDPTNVGPEGKLVKAKLAISIPNSIRTYAPGASDLYAAPEEIYADHIDVFIYENGGSYAVDHHHFIRTASPDFTSTTPPDEGEFKNPSDGTTFVTAEFDVKEGDKLVYVGINLPDLIVDRLRTGYYVNEIFEDDDLLAELLSGSPGAGGASNLAFFSSTRGTNVTFAEADVVDDYTFNVSVNRLVAKVVVTTAGGATSTAFNDVSGGTITNFQFAVGQLNNQMFVAPLLGTPGEDPNHADNTIPFVGAPSSPHNNRILQAVNTGDYKDINGPLVAGDGDFQNPATYVQYATENTSASHRHQDVTYVSIKAEFIPHLLGADPTSGDASTYYSGPTLPELYAVFTGDNTDGVDALGARYFDDLADARAFVTGTWFTTNIAGHAIVASATPNHDSDAIQGESDHYIFFYDNSECYYRIYLNPTGNSGATHPYDVLRNTVYVANITGVNYIGTTKPDAIPGGYEDGSLSEATVTGAAPGTYRGTPIYPGDWFPKTFTGTPIFPDDVISITPVATGLNVEISIEPWDVDDPSEGYELN